jgi:hypothetical protein
VAATDVAPGAIAEQNALSFGEGNRLGRLLRMRFRDGENECGYSRQSHGNSITGAASKFVNHAILPRNDLLSRHQTRQAGIKAGC